MGRGRRLLKAGLRLTCGVLAALAVGLSAGAQAPVVRQAAPDASAATPARAADPVLDEALAWKGLALLLRESYAGDRLEFDRSGHLLGGGGSAKTTDWTLAGFELVSVSRGDTAVAGRPAIALDGLRVAIRYNPQQHQFERHPQKDEHMKILVETGPDAAAVDRALAAVFSVGMDPAFERAATAPWRHYFDPQAPWPKDELTGQTVLSALTGLPAHVTAPELQKKVEPGFSSEAEHDKVKGTVVLEMVVDPAGTPRRVRIVQPLGYGLDERAVEAVERFRFRPAMRDGVAVPMMMQVREEFAEAVPQGR